MRWLGRGYFAPWAFRAGPRARAKGPGGQAGSGGLGPHPSFTALSIVPKETLTNLLMTFERPLKASERPRKGLLKVVQRPFEGLRNAFSRPLKGFLKAFQKPFEGLLFLFWNPLKAI